VTSAEFPAYAKRIEFLSDARNHPFATSRVEVVETHMSWVFLTDRHAYKLKKPIRLEGHDLAFLEERESQCRNEVDLNRRLSEGVYLGVAQLSIAPDGKMRLGEGRAVDWLVWMRRLPDALMLDRLVTQGQVDETRLAACIEMLARFYASAAPEPIAPGEYREHLRARIQESLDALRLPQGGLPLREVLRIANAQLAFLDENAALFDARVRSSRIVEGHGDLRPEHVCLESPPQIIDCLEFSRVLRMIDPVEELGFLGMECARLGAPELDAVIFRAYRRVAGDDPDDRLVHFHKSVTACVRAKLAVWHVSEPGPKGADAWRHRASGYLALAAHHIDGSPIRCAIDASQGRFDALRDAGPQASSGRRAT